MALGPLNINWDLSQVKVAMPVITDGQIVPIKLINVEGVLKDNDASKPMTKWEFHTTAPVPTTEGDTLAPGHKIMITVSAFAKPETLDQDWYKKKVAGMIDALCNTGDPNNSKGLPARPPFNDDTISKMIGLECLAKCSVGNDDKGVPRNDYRLISKQAAAA